MTRDKLESGWKIINNLEQVQMRLENMSLPTRWEFQHDGLTETQRDIIREKTREFLFFNQAWLIRELNNL